MEIAALGLKVDGVANIDQATSSLDRFKSSADGAEKSSSGLGDASSRSAKSVNDLGRNSSQAAGGMGALGAAAGRVGGIIAAAFTVTAIKNYADAWSDMRSSVGAALGDMDGAADRMTRLVDIANAAYSPLQQTAAVYARNVSTFRDLGRSAEEAADFTEAVNNALVTTATRGQNADVVIGSLSRSLAIGKLDADAFDTIVSRSPRVLKAMADQMGVTTSQLRALASQGKVTSDVISTGLISSLDQLREEAALMPATITDAFVRVQTNVTEFIGKLDEASGASAAVAGAILGAADAIRSISGSESGLDAVITGATALAAVLAARLVPSIVASGTSFAAATASAVQYQFALARMAGVSAPAAAGLIAVGGAARVAGAAMALLGGPAGVVFLAATALTFFVTSASAAEKEAAALDGRISKLTGSFEEMLPAAREKAAQDLADKISQLGAEIEKGERKAVGLNRSLASMPNSSAADGWRRSLLDVNAQIESQRGQVKGLQGDLLRLSKIGEQSAKPAEDIASQAFTTMKAQLEEQLAVAGKLTDAAKLRARIEGGYVAGLKKGEGDVLITLQQQIDAREKAGEASKKATQTAEAASKKQAQDAKRLLDNLQQEVFQTQKRTAVEELAFDIKKDSINLSDTQLKQAEDLARQIDAAAIAERNKSAEIDRQNTMYQLQEGLISRQQQYDAELGTAGMGDRAAAQAKERIALEQAAQRELRDITHQHGQEMREAETEDQRKHLQAMYEERLLLTREAQAKELQSYDEFTQQKNALDQDWMAGAQSAFATYSEQATNLYAQTADMVTSTLDSVSEGIAQSATDAILKGEDFRSSMAAVGDAIIENILGSLIKMGVQLAINAAIGKAFGSAAVAASVAEAAAISTAWATPAAFVSLATFGANSAAAISGIAATTAMSQGLAVAGFQQGGYTGNMGVSDVAGVVHGREYVFDAAATSRIGVPTLEAIRSGRSVDGSGAIVRGQAGDPSMPAMSVRQNFVINGDPDKSTLAMIKKAAADGARMGYQQVANDISSGRGVVSKSLQQGFQVGRRKQ